MKKYGYTTTEEGSVARKALVPVPPEGEYPTMWRLVNSVLYESTYDYKFVWYWEREVK